jgi:hypothetical protein
VSDAEEAPNRAVLVFIAVSPLVALGFETASRKAILGPEFNEVRDFLRPFLTPYAWGFCALTVLFSVAAVPVRRRLEARALARLGERARDPRRRADARLSALYLASSVPQLPSLFATFSFTMGAQLLPVVLCLALSALGVLALGLSDRPAVG